MKTLYLVLWWMSQSPYAALFENLVAAEAAASVRNAVLVTITGSGKSLNVPAVVDWYRRDEKGTPLSAEWRDIMGQVRMPWGPPLRPGTVQNDG